jgi:hypothetical protein
MPNHCHNRVTFYAQDCKDETRAQIAKLKEIFSGESIFGQIIPEPDWANMPLLTSDTHYGTKYGNDGELPILQTDRFGDSLRFQSTGIADQRWYDWRLQNWDTKWDAYDVEQHDFDDPDQYEVTFNTAWSPPDAICHKIREDYPDVSVSWFYDEPGCEIAGYL